MRTHRREFITTSAGIGCLGLAADLFRQPAAEAAARQPYEEPLFNLKAVSSDPIRIASIELLRNGDHYFVRSVSADGAVGIAETKQVHPDFLKKARKVELC